MKRVFLLLFVLAVFSITVQAQTRTVTGTVSDQNGELLIGVSVVVKETKQATSTDVAGKFRITIPDRDNVVLTFTYISFKTQEITVGNQTTLKVTMQSDTKALEEVVVIGYGTVKKRDLTGSVGSVSSETITNRGTTSVAAALQGSVAGVDINTSSAKPGGSFSVQIRGQNSLNPDASKPLYVVDGIVMSDIDFLNPADIEKIDILKDASSTAIYGSRGSSGVVIVQTKGSNLSTNTKSSITYDGYYGVRSLARIPDFMSGREWVDFRTSAFYTYNSNLGRYEITPSNKNAILQQSPLLASRLLNEDYEDWLGLATKNGTQQNHYINIAGSGGKISYNLGIGYQNEKGNFINENLNRYNIKLAVNNKISDKFTVGGNINLSQTVTNQGSEFGYRDVLRMPSILKAYDENGNLIAQPGIATSIQGVGNFTSSPNPLNEINSGNQENRRYEVLGNVFAQYSFIKGLDFRSSFMPRFNRNRLGRYYGVVPGNRTLDVAFQENIENFEYTWDNQLTYNRTFGKDHSLNATFINSIYKTRYERFDVGAEDFAFNPEWYNILSGTKIQRSANLTSPYTETALLSYTARANYTYKGKYLFTGTVRYDGSSKLDDKWEAFPSMAFAWRASEESFLKADFLSDLKARLSFGYSGSNSGINPYESSLNPVTSNLILYDFNGLPVSGFAPGRPVNPGLTWEKTREVNFGIDFGFFNQRISGSIDLYDKLSDGLLLNRTLSIESGVDYVKDNIGSVNNKGIELALNTVNVSTKDFRWTTSLNFATNKNAIRTLYGKKEDVPGEFRFIGEPINVVYDYKIIGIWKSDQVEEARQWSQQVGQARAQDINNNGSITAADDRVILGTPDPSWTGNFSSSLTYKNWDFSFNINTRQGVFVSDRFLEEFGPANVQRGRPKIVFDYFVPAGIDRYDWNNFGTNPNGSPSATWGTAAGNEDAKYPAINNAGPYYGNNGQYTNASYVKVRNIILGYTVPKKVLGRVKLSQLRVYANILNPFTITNYKGWDPEYATTTLQNGNGPSSVTYQFGVNMKF